MDPAALPLWEGFSAFDTEQRARSKAEAFPALGKWIAELEMPDVGPVQYRRTTRARGHYTVWGSSAIVCRCIVRMIVV